MAGGALVVVLGVAGVVAQRRFADERPWADMQVALNAFEARHVDRTGERPVLWGRVTEGSARVHYDRAVDLALELDPRRVERAREAATEAERADRAALLVEACEVLDELSVGAHRREVGTPHELAPVSTRRTKAVRAVVHLAEARAAACLDAGDDLAAVHALLDAMQFGADLSVGPRLVDELLGLAAVLPTSVERVLQGEDLDPAARTQLVDGLVALDRRLAWRGPAFATEVLGVARELERALGGPSKPSDDGAIAAAQEERCACGVRTEVARQVRLALALEVRHAGAFELPPDEAVAELLTFLEEARALDDAERLTLSANPARVVRTRLATIARLRLLVNRLEGRTWPRDPWLRALLDGDELTHPLFGS